MVKNPQDFSHGTLLGKVMGKSHHTSAPTIPLTYRQFAVVNPLYDRNTPKCPAVPLPPRVEEPWRPVYSPAHGNHRQSGAGATRLHSPAVHWRHPPKW